MRKDLIERLKKDAFFLWETRRKEVLIGVGILVVCVFYGLSDRGETARVIHHVPGQEEFKDGRILSRSSDDYHRSKERMMNKKTKEVIKIQREILSQLKGIKDRVDTIENSPKPREVASQKSVEGKPPELKLHGQTGNYTLDGPTRKEVRAGRWAGVKPRSRARGPAIVSFPVKLTRKETGVVLPSGSYVRAKLMHGVDSMEGKPLPSLLVLDFAFVGPNQSKVDLSGCFMLAKSEANLSRERVDLQVNKLSCVSRKGKFFEKIVNGYVIDDRDQKLSLKGKVNSKQDRVAAAAFLASVVEGAGKAIQSQNTTSATTPLGGSQSIVTGDKIAHLAAGGVSNAAGLVAKWYLKHAESLKPTIEIKSGLEVWVVMNDKARLPNEYFHKAKRSNGNEKSFSYLSRLLD